MTAPKITLLRGDPLYGQQTAGGAITPGMLVAVAGSAVVAASAGEVSPVFAREMEIVGNDLDVEYAADDTVLTMHNRRGDWVYALLAAGQSVSAGDQLSAGASGSLVAATIGSQSGTTPFAVTFPTPVIAKALETINNNPGVGGAAVRIKVEIV